MNITPQKKIIIITTAAGLLILAALFLILKPRTFTAGFYGIPEQTTVILTGQITQLLNAGGQHQYQIAGIVYDTGEPLVSQISKQPKADIVFVSGGINAEEAAVYADSIHSGVSAGLATSLPSAIKAAAFTGSNGSITGLPLLLDHYELALSRLAMHTDGIPNSGIPAGLVFAGSDDRTLLAYAGALTESVSGQHAAEQLVQSCMTQLPADNPLLQNAARLIAEQIAAKQLHPLVLQLTEQDVAALMEQNTSAAFISLSTHRTLPVSTVKQYDTVFFPSPNTTRALTIPVLYAIPTGRTGSRKAATEHVLAELAGTAAQYQLSAQTGLAPVHSHAETADIQADDVRYWAAAAGTIMPDLGNAACSTDLDRTQTAAALREMIQSELVQMAANLLPVFENTAFAQP